MMEDIHDIRPPMMVGMDPALVKTAAWTCGGLVLAVLVVLGVIYFMKGRKKKGEAIAELRHIPPCEAAIKALDRLATGPVHDAKAFYFDLGRILKTYLAETYGFNCLEMTTQELVRQMRRMEDLPGGLKSEISLFQDLCDPFRYGPLDSDQAPDHEQVNKDLAQGRALILAMETARPVKEEQD